jgi:hypothetical protein
MSSIRKRERQLILGLLLSRISEDEFYREYPTKPEEASSVGLAMLRRALQERDPVGVEFGLYLGHRFGISPDYLDVLLSLASADWHERHEDVVDGLAKLKAPASASRLYEAALAEHPYRQYDEANTLGVKAVRALGSLQTQEAIVLLGRLLCGGNAALKSEALAQLRRVESGAKSDVLRVAAHDALRAGGDGADK